MKRSAHGARVVGLFVLLGSLLAATIAPVAAQEVPPGDPAMDSLFTTAGRDFLAGENTIYYPWVANRNDFGLGPADTSISVQNLEDRDSQLWFYTGNGDGTWSLATSAYLSRYASKTFTAAELGIAPGTGAPVAVLAYQVLPGEATTALIETTVVLSNPVAGEDAGGTSTKVLACVVNEHRTEGLGTPAPFRAAVAFTWDGMAYAAGSLVTWESQADLQAILNAVNAGNTGSLINPFGGLNNDGDCLDRVGSTDGTGQIFNSVAIGGVAKMAAAGASLPSTTGADTAVSGYNAINGAEVSRFNQWYLPIVQTNGEPGGTWDSVIRIANLSNVNNAVTIRFFPANDGSGSLQTGFQIEQLVHGGETWDVTLSSLVPDGWVGSAHILSDGWVFPMVDRFKAGYSMWMTNTGSAANFENGAQIPNGQGRYALFAPHVLMDYFGWNTGINVTNLADSENNVSIQYFNMLGNATEVLNQRLAPHGMTYFYDPSQPPQGAAASDPDAGVVGSAIIWSDQPVAAAVDATKYPESDPRGGLDLFQATSYNATANVYTWQAVPLVQKGNPADGMGPTSGINIMNPNAVAATANVYFVNPSGFNAQNFGVSSVTIPGFANGFVYTMWQHNLPNGFVGSAQVVANVPVAAVSANVDYQVDGDGAAIFNAFNPCGFYRTLGGACYPDGPVEIEGGTVIKTFVNELNEPVAGVQFHLAGQGDLFPYQRHGVTGPDGTATLADVPAGDYVLNVDAVPSIYQLPDNPADTFTLVDGGGWVETNVLTLRPSTAVTVTKTVCVAEDSGFDPDTGYWFECSDVNLVGINVDVYSDPGGEEWELAMMPLDADLLVYSGLTDDTGVATMPLEPGDYILCMYEDPAGTVTTTTGDAVTTDLPGAIAWYGDCITLFGERFTVEPGMSLDLVNEAIPTPVD